MNDSKSGFRNWIIALRNDFHKHPELSTQEKRTTRQICKELKLLNILPRTFDDITGVTGLLRGGKQGPGEGRTIAVRAEIDALPIQELNHKENRSIHTEVMHACGHDVHTASLLGTAIILQEIKNDFSGTPTLPKEAKFTVDFAKKLHKIAEF